MENLSFNSIGFSFQGGGINESVYFQQGKDFGIYLLVGKDYFSVKLVCHHIEEYLFRWQGFENPDEIVKILKANHILHEQIFGG